MEDKHYVQEDTRRTITIIWRQKVSFVTRLYSPLTTAGATGVNIIAFTVGPFQKTLRKCKAIYRNPLHNVVAENVDHKRNGEIWY